MHGNILDQPGVDELFPSVLIALVTLHTPVALDDLNGGLANIIVPGEAAEREVRVLSRRKLAQANKLLAEIDNAPPKEATYIFANRRKASSRSSDQ